MYRTPSFLFFGGPIRESHEILNAAIDPPWNPHGSPMGISWKPDDGMPTGNESRGSPTRSHGPALQAHHGERESHGNTIPGTGFHWNPMPVPWGHTDPMGGSQGSGGPMGVPWEHFKPMVRESHGSTISDYIGIPC